MQGGITYVRSPRKRSNSALFRHPALQRRAAHCGLHSCRCKAGVHVYVGRAGPSEQFVRGHHHPAVPQAGLRELPQIPAGAGAGCHGAAGDRPAHPGGRAGRAASGSAGHSGQPGRGAAGHHSGHRHPAAAAGALAAAQLRGHRGGV